MQIPINLAPAVRENPLNLDLDGLSVAQRLDAYAESLQEQAAAIAGPHGEGAELIHCQRADEVTFVIDVDSTKKRAKPVAKSVRALKKFIEYTPEGIFSYVDCGDDLGGFILLARRGVPARVVHQDEGWKFRYTYLANHVFVKELVTFSGQMTAEHRTHVVGKTMFADVPPGKFSEHYLGGAYSALHRFFGPLKDGLEAIAPSENPPLDENGNQPIGQEYSDESAETSLMRLVPVRRIISSPGQGLFENILFIDKESQHIPVESYCRRKRSERPEDFSQVNMLDADAFFLAHCDRIERVIYEHWQAQGGRHAAVYQRIPQLELLGHLADYPEIEFLPLYEFFSNFNLMDIAAKLYEHGLTYIKLNDRKLVSCSVVGDVKMGMRQFNATTRSLSKDYVRGLILDLKLAKSWRERRAEISDLGRWCAQHNVPMALVLSAVEAADPPDWLPEAGADAIRVFTYMDQAVAWVDSLLS